MTTGLTPEQTTEQRRVRRTLRMLDGLATTELRGVGPRKASALSAMGINTVLDLLHHYPRRYVDRSHMIAVADTTPGEEAMVVGSVTKVATRRPGRGRTVVQVSIDDGTATLSCTFFNQPWRASQLAAGLEVALFGTVELFRGHRQMVNPVVDVIGTETGRQTGKVVAIYPQSGKAGVGSSELAKYLDEVLERAKDFAEPVPERYLRERKLIGRTDAYHSIHAPDEYGEQYAARRRLAFDELLRLQMLLVMRKRAAERESRGIAHATEPGGGRSPGLVEHFVSGLPFKLTGAQERALRDIATDLAAPPPMHRLLQGDVGAGKTVVALAALLYGVQGGYQGALMAPTEVLAEQHFLGSLSLLTDLAVADPARLGGQRPVGLALLTNRTTAAERTRLHAELRAGTVDILVGTHALLTEEVRFRALGVVVIDEQHRFGVEQRAALRDKGGLPGAGEEEGRDPDVLVMTATPIPRTAAMTVYGDLDLTTLDEIPAGRTPVRTSWCESPEDTAKAFARIRSEVAAGHQAYVVCPLVGGDEPEGRAAGADESGDVLAGGATDADGQGILFVPDAPGPERSAPRAVVEEYARLTAPAGELAGIRVALLHGQMPPRQKETVMAQFRRGDIDVLVATTVIEVGVDVTNATVMVIEDADRFGIAQLHQLRGRVGRGRDKSWCYLLATEVTPEGAERLHALERSTDGFELAEVDLDLRGEGTVLGTHQKGRSDLKLASLRRDRDLVSEARAVAVAIVQDDPRLDEHALLADELRLFVSDEDAEFLFKS
jgi:ATP-dependent DNA helicase RecG